MIRETLAHTRDVSSDNLYPLLPPFSQGLINKTLDKPVLYADKLEFGSTLMAMGMLTGDAMTPLLHYANIRNVVSTTDNALMSSLSEEYKQAGRQIGAVEYQVNSDNLPMFLNQIDEGKVIYRAAASFRDMLVEFKHGAVTFKDISARLEMPSLALPEQASKRMRVRTSLANKVMRRLVNFSSNRGFDEIDILSNDKAEHMIQAAAHTTYEIQLTVERAITVVAVQALASLTGGQIDKRNGLQKVLREYSNLRAADTKIPKSDIESNLDNDQLIQELIWNKVSQILQKTKPNSEEQPAYSMLESLSSERKVWQSETHDRETYFAAILDQERAQKLQRFGRIVIERSLSHPETSESIESSTLATKEKSPKETFDPELLHRYEALLAAHGKLVEPYRMSRNNLKRYGLSNFQRQLRQSVTADESYRVGAVTKGLQEQLVDTDSETLKITLEVTLQEEAVIAEQLREQSLHISAIDKSVTLSTINRVSKDIALMQDQWPSVEEALLTSWPEHPERLIEQLKNLLGIELPALQIAVPDNIESGLTIMPLSLDEQLNGQAQQLDFVAFPSSSDRRALLEADVKEHTTIENNADVEMWRIRLLDTIASEMEGNLYKTLPKGFGAEMPWYVAHFTVPGTTTSIAIVESPLYGSATYIVKDEYADFWKELISLFSRQEARQLQAKQVIHPERELLNRAQVHKIRLQEKISNIVSVQNQKP